MNIASTARITTLLAAGACGATAAVTLVTTAALDAPAPSTTVVLLATAILLLQGESALTKLSDAERRRTHRLPWGNAALALLASSAILLSLPLPLEVQLSASATSFAGMLAAAYWAMTSLEVIFKVDERYPKPQMEHQETTE